MRKKIILISLLLSSFALPIFAGGRIDFLEIMGNDNLKTCRLYDSSNSETHEIPKDWRFISGNHLKAKEICASMGYEFEEKILTGKLRPLYRNISIIHAIAFVLIIFYFLRRGLKMPRKINRKQYLLSLLFLILKAIGWLLLLELFIISLHILVTYPNRSLFLINLLS